MRILFVTSEIAPYSKTGGLADVAGALTGHLREAGHEVVTVSPRHREVDPVEHLLTNDERLRGGVVELGAHRWEWRGLRDADRDVVFVDLPALYDRPALYGDEPDEHLRFAALCRVALDVCRHLSWAPEVVHCNDWQTALVPALLRGPLAQDPWVGGAASVLTVHNLGYQGRFGAHVVDELGLEGHHALLDRSRLAEGEVNLLATGLLQADLITTVSPTYAREIQTPEGGAGLHDILRRRRQDLVGVLNGIDTREWNPRTDPLIPWRYSERSLWRKEWNKQALLERVSLPHRRDVPVIGLVGRLVWQKGIEIMRTPLLHFLDTWDVRLVVLGSGEDRYEDLFRWMADSYGDRAAFVAGYDRELSHLIEAGADVFLMPSLYEPCGLNQMYSLAYGTPPVVRKVGGLADTVTPYDRVTGSGTGFVFEHYTEDGLGWALGQALALHTQRAAWRRLQRNGMETDNSWGVRAGEYEEVYRRALRRRAAR